MACEPGIFLSPSQNVAKKSISPVETKLRLDLKREQHLVAIKQGQAEATHPSERGYEAPR